ncbi:TRAP transporter substrate-binding protein [Bacillus sp. UNC41MFS5]|uniref:TRAP transporter substrate-binding protein n=1 Tax=Bacillus sp. UNC41MFS5 TaxID=1449046 RepID=UPI00047A9A8F|nr:TRAP transporter substrate-binding protein [Bacillus sp. UNC41MFS5]
MNRKLFTKKLLAGMVIASVALAGCGLEETSKQQGTSSGKNTEGPKYTFRLSDTLAPDHPTVAGGVNKFAELVNERTNGRIQIKVFPSSQLGEEKATLEQVQLGSIDFVRTGAGALAGFSKSFEVFSLPYIFEDDAHQWRFLGSEGGTKLLDSLESSRMKGLTYYSSGARHFYSSKPLKNISDLKGQKIRVIQNEVNMDLIKALGGNATPMPYGEVFSALQTGVIDAAENNYPNFVTSNHYQEVKYVLEDQHQRVPEVLVISKVTWDKLSEADRKIIKQAALDSVKTQRELFDKFEQDAQKKVKDAGLTVTQVTDYKPWKKAVEPVIDKYRKDYKDILDAIEKEKQ